MAHPRFVLLALLALAPWCAASRLAAADVPGPYAKLIEALPERSLPELQKLLAHGVEHAPNVLMRRWDEEQSWANARGARSSMLPNVYAYASGGVIKEQRTDGNRQIPDRTLEALLYNAGVSQPIFHWGALSKTYQASKLYAAISARNLEETRRLLAVDLRRRYYDLVIAHGSLNLARQNLAQLRKNYEFAQKRVADGFSPLSEASTFELQIRQTEMEVQRLANDYDQLTRNFARLTGLPVDKLPVPVREIPKLPAGMGETVKALVDETAPPSSARLSNLDDTMRAERLNYEIAKTRLRPKFGLSFSVNQDNRNPDNNVLGEKALITSWNAFATVNWSIFDGFGAQAAQRASLSRLRSYELDRDAAERQEHDERRGERLRLQLGWRQLQEAEINFSGSQSSVALYEKDVAAGWIPESQLVEARRAVDVYLQSANVARADFYTTLLTYLSNRGLDPAVSSPMR